MPLGLASTAATYGTIAPKRNIDTAASSESPTKVRWHARLAVGLLGLLGMSLYVSHNEGRITSFGTAALVSAFSGDLRARWRSDSSGEDGHHTIQPFFTKSDGAVASAPVMVAPNSPHFLSKARASVWGVDTYKKLPGETPHKLFVGRYDFSASYMEAVPLLTAEKTPRESSHMRLLGTDGLLGPAPKGGIYIFSTAACASVREIYSGSSSGFFAAYNYAARHLPAGGEGAYVSEGACVSLTIDPGRCRISASKNEEEVASVSVLVLGVGAPGSLDLNGTTDSVNCRAARVTVGPLAYLKKVALADKDMT